MESAVKRLLRDAISLRRSVGRGWLAGLLSRLFRIHTGGNCVIEKFGLASRGFSEAGIALYRLLQIASPLAIGPTWKLENNVDASGVSVVQTLE